jgi:ABC-2 type transport system permease protein
MRKIRLITLHEIKTMITRPSFLFAAFGIPLISALVMLVVTAINRQSPDTMEMVFGPASQPVQEVEGYVDSGHLLQIIPPLPENYSLRAFPDETSARAALAAGEINAYSIIAADYVDSGNITYVRPDFTPLNAFTQSGIIRQALQANLLNGDLELSARVTRPLSVNMVSQAPEQERQPEHPLTFLIPYIVTMAYYVIILMSASFLLQSVTKEKENRVLEIMLLTVTPRQMLVGKIIGLGIVGLLQTLVWIGFGFGVLRISGNAYNLPTSFQLPVSFLVWGVIFFVFGYIIYASLMASIGALVPNMREASQATFVVIFPLIIPMLFISALIEQPQGAVATVFSLFPLTAPVAMMTRLAAAPVPLWQLLLAIALMAVTAGLLIRSAAGLFHAQTLFAGQPFKLKRFFAALAGRI